MPGGLKGFKQERPRRGCSSRGSSGAEAQRDGADFGKITKPYNVKEGTVSGDGTIQLSLFQLDDPTLSSMRDTLKKADLNNMTPMQAFDLLRDMKKELGI